VCASGNLGGYHHAGLFFHALQPFQAFLAYAFKASGVSARLPDAGSKYLYTCRAEAAGGGYHLFFGLSAAWTGNYQRFAVGVDVIEDGENIFHRFLLIFKN
jgi:hypothetical protein